MMERMYQVSPHSVKNFLVVKSVIPAEHITLSIFSSEGLLCKECEMSHPTNKNEYRIDLSKLPKGEYYLMINSGNENRIERLEKK